eukprot:TRINITY_DN80448_c0_g1_i1.p1 TRINITY_DN80448_c0_g1~~TRINITY_DN80448_c0_g1_i1.p1  ORF type:complete len:109 (+),score=18.08 TRINITY_DN80448_c0_g1_i1:94-420(+)
MGKSKYEMVVGLTKGHKVTKNESPAAPVSVKGKNTKHNKFIREVAREVCGFAPYEKRCIELLRISRDKRALKFCKKRLGTHIRAKRKRDELSGVLIAQRKAAAHKDPK